MKKSYFAVLALASLLLCCDPNGGGGETPDPVGTTYPRLQVIEHFTGQGCGYCPNGMNQIYEVYSQNPDGYIWITNHTYNKDDFTISESNTIAKKLKVSGAPEISLDRTKYDGSRTYHPYYLASYTLKEATTATSVVILSRQYDAATRELTITATGKTGDQDLDSVLLTVAITESGVIATQEDYMYTWEGWQKFVHTHAVRMFATAALGDPVRMKNRTFSATYKVTLKDKWVADNCEIVAWITPGADNWPVLNAAKLAVVEGTQGGEDIRHGGLEEYPVADTYPERGTPNAETVMKVCNASYWSTSEATIMYMVFSNPDSAVYKLSNTPMLAYSELFLLVPSGSATIPTGTYNLVPSADAAVGDAVAGYRNDETHTLNGSTFLWLYKSGSSMYLARQWMLAGGTVVVTEGGLEVTGTTKNGSPVHYTYTGAITPVSQSAAPQQPAYRLSRED